MIWAAALTKVKLLRVRARLDVLEMVLAASSPMSWNMKPSVNPNAISPAKRSTKRALFRTVPSTVRLVRVTN